MVREILIWPHPVLKKKATPVAKVDESIRTLVKDMFETMYDAPGIGLAAVQVGVPKRLLVIDLQEEEDEEGKPVKDPRVFINPEILEESDSFVPYKEGCLSIPEVYGEVERASRVVVRALNERGEPVEIEADELLARCLQHEIDHLDGVLFVDRLSALKRNMILRKMAKERKQKERP